MVFTAISVYFPLMMVAKENRSSSETIGPHEPVFWSNLKIFTLDGTYSASSQNYFELYQEGQIPKQAILEDPEVGKGKGLYWIRDFPMAGDWRTTSSAELFNPTETQTITTVYTSHSKALNGFLGFMFGFIIWIVLMVFLSWIDSNLLQ